MKEYSYNIINDVYNWMISMKKDIEVRILKEKSQAIQVGDIVTFTNLDNVNQFVKVKIINKKLVNNIDELLEKYSVSRIMPGHSEDDLRELIWKIYGGQLNEKQIVAFEFKFLSCDKEAKKETSF